MPKVTHILACAAIVLAPLLAIQEAPAALPPGRPLTIGLHHPPPTDAAAPIATEAGFEAEIARALGETLQVPVALVAVPAGGEAAALAAGRIDAVVLRIGADDTLRGQTPVLPTGFSSGVTVATRSDRPAASWAALDGGTLCVAAGEDEAPARALNARLRVEATPAAALIALRTGQCDGALGDELLLEALVAKSDWRKFSALLPAAAPRDLVVATRPDDAALTRALASALATIGSAERWTARREHWASTVALEVYVDQVGRDCH